MTPTSVGTNERVCPRCKTVSAGRAACVRCGQRLAETAVDATRPPRLQTRLPPYPGVNWIERCLVALMLAQGIYFGVRLLYHSLAQEVPVLGEFNSVFLSSLSEQILQVSAMLVAALATCGGHAYGLLVGSLMGLVNAGLLLLTARALNGTITPEQWIGFPLLQLLAGMLGGATAMRIWRPFRSLPNLELREDPNRDSETLLQQAYVPPVRWGRVLCGTAIAVGGSCWAHQISEFLNRSAAQAAGGGLYYSSFFVWEIATLLVIFGGAWAGGTTGCGLKQGILTGILTASILMGLVHTVGLEQFQAYNLVLEQFKVPTEGGLAPRDLFLYVGGNTFLASIFGGWLGGQLLPPLLRRRKSLPWE